MKIEKGWNLLLLWLALNFVVPELVYYTDIVTIENSSTAGPIAFGLIQLSNLTYYKLSKELFFSTMFLNVSFLIFFGEWSAFGKILSFFMSPYY